MASKKIHHGTQATTCLCSRGSDHWTTEIPTLPHANGAAGAAICLCDLRARLDPKGRSSCCSHHHIEIPRGRPVQIETCMYKCLNTDETHTLDGTGTHTHTFKAQAGPIQSPFCPCLRSNTCKKSQHIVRSAKTEQSKPTCSGFSARCSCRICMHTSGGRHLHWTQAVCAAHINVSVACEEHNMNTRQCHRHTSFLHHNKLMTSLDAAEECEETVFRRGHEWLHNS